jgi:hypothetical protein
MLRNLSERGSGNFDVLLEESSSLESLLDDVFSFFNNELSSVVFFLFLSPFFVFLDFVSIEFIDFVLNQGSEFSFIVNEFNFFVSDGDFNVKFGLKFSRSVFGGFDFNNESGEFVITFNLEFFNEGIIFVLFVF